MFGLLESGSRIKCRLLQGIGESSRWRATCPCGGDLTDEATSAEGLLSLEQVGGLRLPTFRPLLLLLAPSLTNHGRGAQEALALAEADLRLRGLAHHLPLRADEAECGVIGGWLLLSEEAKLLLAVTTESLATKRALFLSVGLAS